MSKIVRAVNSMISNSDKISDVIRSENEYFFLYKKKYKWSISSSGIGDQCTLFYYPNDTSLEQLASLDEDAWFDGSVEYIKYSAKELNSREASETFSELYLLIREKTLGVDKMFDDIIGEDF